MKLKDLQIALTELFSANFVAYYRSHVAHVNTIGRNFYADHQLLGTVYEYFQDNIDTIAEIIRTVKARMPDSINTVLEQSPIMDMPTDGDSTDLLSTVLEAIEEMVEQYHAVNDIAEEVNYIDVANFAQDQIGKLVKMRWMIESTLGVDHEDEDQDD